MTRIGATMEEERIFEIRLFRVRRPVAVSAYFASPSGRFPSM
jgi:hypothetical protein